MPLASPITTYSDTTPQKRVITDVISIIDPRDTPLIDQLGGLDGASGKFRFVNGESTKVEWLEDTLFALTDALGASVTLATTVLTVADATKFQEGDIVMIDLEYAWVSDITTTTTITVTRNYGGTQASHADAAVVEIVGQARLEGADSQDRAFTDRTSNYNYTEILHHEVKVTRTQNQISQYGIDNEMEYQGRKVIPSILRFIEKLLYHGQQKAGSATTPRAFGGLGTYITDNTVSTTILTQAKIEDAAKASWADGGIGPWLAPISAANQQVVKNLYDSSTVLRVEREETTVGMLIDRVTTPFGDVRFVLDRWSPSSKLYLIDVSHAGLKTFYPFSRETLAKVGDADREEVVGEFTFCVRQDKAHAVITGIS